MKQALLAFLQYLEATLQVLTEEVYHLSTKLEKDKELTWSGPKKKTP